MSNASVSHRVDVHEYRARSFWILCVHAPTSSSDPRNSGVGDFPDSQNSLDESAGGSSLSETVCNNGDGIDLSHSAGLRMRFASLAGGRMAG